MKESPKAMDKREVVYKYFEMPITQHWHLWKQMEWTPVIGTEQERDKAFFKWVKENNKTSQLMTLLGIEKKAMDKTDNEIIAEFMGLHFDESGQCTDPERKYSWRPGVYDPLEVEHLQYDTSWAWIMPVVEKIESLRYDTRIQWFTSAADYGDMHCMSIETWHGATIIYQKSQTKIEAVYKAVVEFIKWYNSQNNGQ